MTLDKVICKRVITAPPQETLANVARLMERNSVSAVVIIENNRPAGIVTERDLALGTLLRGFRPDDHVQTIMAYPAKTVRSDESIASARDQMVESGVCQLPVVDQREHLIGIVTLDDLLRELRQEGGSTSPEKISRPIKHAGQCA